MNLVDSSGWLEYFADGKNADFFSFGGRIKLKVVQFLLRVCV